MRKLNFKIDKSTVTTKSNFFVKRIGKVGTQGRVDFNIKHSTSAFFCFNTQNKADALRMDIAYSAKQYHKNAGRKDNIDLKTVKNIYEKSMSIPTFELEKTAILLLKRETLAQKTNLVNEMIEAQARKLWLLYVDNNSNESIK